MTQSVTSRVNSWENGTSTHWPGGYILVILGGFLSEAALIEMQELPIKRELLLSCKGEFVYLLLQQIDKRR